MRLPSFTALALAVSAAFGAKPSEERFNTYHAKSLTAAPLKLGDAGYRALTSAPRDYSVNVLLTAIDARFGCQLCREFQSEWELLARSWVKGDKKGESRTLFATLDFAEGRETFLSVSGTFGRALVGQRRMWVD
jgi:oligosaccharyltransferase complex subunit gamma